MYCAYGSGLAGAVTGAAGGELAVAESGGAAALAAVCESSAFFLWNSPPTRLPTDDPIALPACATLFSGLPPPPAELSPLAVPFAVSSALVLAMALHCWPPIRTRNDVFSG